MKIFIMIIISLNSMFAEITDFYKTPEEPIQVKIQPKKIKLNGSELELIYKFKIEARVVSAKRYAWDDMSNVMTHDLGVTWGSISETKNFNQIKWDQSNRFLIYSMYENVIPKLGGIDYINSHVANIHLIPKDWTVEATLNKIKDYDIVSIEGYLTDVRKGNKIVYTSDRRDDNGPGACEVIYVEKINIKVSRTNNPFYYQEKKNKLSKNLNFNDSEFTKPGEKTRAAKNIE